MSASDKTFSWMFHRKPDALQSLLQDCPTHLSSEIHATAWWGV